MAPQILPNGTVNQGFIIRSFYLRKDDVPFPARFYGDIPCMFDFCQRKGALGFKTEEDMRMHARSRHRTEYQIRQDTETARRASKADILEERVNQLTAKLLARGPEAAPQPRRGRKPAKRAASTEREHVTIQ
jgi:hypothetical protein